MDAIYVVAILGLSGAIGGATAAYIRAEQARMAVARRAARQRTRIRHQRARIAGYQAELDALAARLAAAHRHIRQQTGQLARYRAELAELAGQVAATRWRRPDDRQRAGRHLAGLAHEWLAYVADLPTTDEEDRR